MSLRHRTIGVLASTERVEGKRSIVGRLVTGSRGGKEGTMPRRASAVSRVPWWTWIIAVDAVLAALITFGTGFPRTRLWLTVLDWFALQNEMNLAVWWSGAQLMLAALLMYERASVGRSDERRAWLILAVVSAGLAFDEIGSIHERLGRRGSWKPLFLVAILLGFALMWALVRLARNPSHRRDVGLIFVAFGLFGLVAGMERLQWQDIEESVELAGFLLLLLAAAGHRRATWGGLFTVIPDPVRLVSLRSVLAAGLLLHAVTVLLIVPQLTDLYRRGDPSACYPFAVYGLLACRAVTAREGATRSERSAWRWLGVLFLLSSIDKLFALTNLAIDIQLVMPRWVYKGTHVTYILLVLPTSLLALRALGWRHRLLRSVIVVIAVLFLKAELTRQVGWLDTLLSGLVPYLWTLVFVPSVASRDVSITARGFGGSVLAEGQRVALAAVRPVLLGLLPVALAAGVWRLERDHPGWLVANPPLDSSRIATSPSSLPRLVLAVHSPWYGTPAGPSGRWWHWNHARIEMSGGPRIVGFHDPRRVTASGRLDVGATHYPEDGPYDSRDPVRIRAQLVRARAAGLNGFAVSWWGHEREEALGLAALFRDAAEAGLVLAPYYQASELRQRGALGIAADLERLLDRHGREAAWLRVAGVPVVFLNASYHLRPSEWDVVRARLAATGRRLFLVADVRSPEWLASRSHWLPHFEAFHVSTPAIFLAGGRDLDQAYRTFASLGRAAGRPFIPAVGPGFDDRSVRRPATVVDRAGGATYDRTWQAALSIEPPWVLVSTWNEWHGGSEIEASVEHGHRYLEATRVWAERFRHGGS